MLQTVNVAILVVPGTALSAVYGLIDLFQSANRILGEFQSTPDVTFSVTRWQLDQEHVISTDPGSRAPYPGHCSANTRRPSLS
ncbi:MAG: hypothetical protein MH208_10520 [Marinobacter sp.]|nr:hypothetical protein [Marinobacter sp.]